MDQTTPVSSRSRGPFVLVGRHLPALDGLRGLAILPVVLYHFAGQFHGAVSLAADAAFLRVCQAGWICVELFFVLSGFLTTGILLDTRDDRRCLKSFYGRHFLRILPPYYATLFGLLVLLPLAAARLGGDLQAQLGGMAEHQLWFWLYAANWLFVGEGTFGTIPGGYFWFLALQEQFYLVWPFVVWWLGRERLARLIAVILPGSVILRLVALAWGAPATSVYAATFTHLDGLLAGALLAVLLRSPAVDLTAVYRRWRRIAAVGVLGLVGLAVWRRGLVFWDDAVAGVGLALLAGCFSFLLLATLRAEAGSAVSRLFSSRLLRSFGRYSYVIYLLHVPIGLALAKVFAPPAHPIAGSLLPAIVAFMLLGMAVCWAAGWLNWNLFEKQVLKLKRYFPHEQERPRTAPPAPTPK